MDGDDHRVVKLIIGHMYNDDDDVPRALKNQHSIRSFYLVGRLRLRRSVACALA